MNTALVKDIKGKIKKLLEDFNKEEFRKLIEEKTGKDEELVCKIGLVEMLLIKDQPPEIKKSVLELIQLNRADHDINAAIFLFIYSQVNSCEQVVRDYALALLEKHAKKASITTCDILLDRYIDITNNSCDSKLKKRFISCFTKYLEKCSSDRINVLFKNAISNVTASHQSPACWTGYLLVTRSLVLHVDKTLLNECSKKIIALAFAKVERHFYRDIEVILKTLLDKDIFLNPYNVLETCVQMFETEFIDFIDNLDGLDHFICPILSSYFRSNIDFNDSLTLLERSLIFTCLLIKHIHSYLPLEFSLKALKFGASLKSSCIRANVMTTFLLIYDQNNNVFDELAIFIVKSVLEDESESIRISCEDFLGDFIKTCSQTLIVNIVELLIENLHYESGYLRQSMSLRLLCVLMKKIDREIAQIFSASLTKILVDLLVFHSFSFYKDIRTMSRQVLNNLEAEQLWTRKRSLDDFSSLFLKHDIDHHIWTLPCEDLVQVGSELIAALKKQINGFTSLNHLDPELLAKYLSNNTIYGPASGICCLINRNCQILKEIPSLRPDLDLTISLAVKIITSMDSMEEIEHDLEFIEESAAFHEVNSSVFILRCCWNIIKYLCKLLVLQESQDVYKLLLYIIGISSEVVHWGVARELSFCVRDLLTGLAIRPELKEKFLNHCLDLILDSKMRRIDGKYSGIFLILMETLNSFDFAAKRKISLEMMEKIRNLFKKSSELKVLNLLGMFLNDSGFSSLIKNKVIDIMLDLIAFVETTYCFTALSILTNLIPYLSRSFTLSNLLQGNTNLTKKLNFIMKSGSDDLIFWSLNLLKEFKEPISNKNIKSLLLHNMSHRNWNVRKCATELLCRNSTTEEINSIVYSIQNHQRDSNYLQSVIFLCKFLVELRFSDFDIEFIKVLEDSLNSHKHHEACYETFYCLLESTSANLHQADVSALYLYFYRINSYTYNRWLVCMILKQHPISVDLVDYIKFKLALTDMIFEGKFKNISMAEMNNLISYFINLFRNEKASHCLFREFLSIIEDKGIHELPSEWYNLFCNESEHEDPILVTELVFHSITENKVNLLLTKFNEWDHSLKLKSFVKFLRRKLNLSTDFWYKLNIFILRESSRENIETLLDAYSYYRFGSKYKFNDFAVLTGLSLFLKREVSIKKENILKYDKFKSISTWKHPIPSTFRIFSINEKIMFQ